MKISIPNPEALSLFELTTEYSVNTITKKRKYIKSCAKLTYKIVMHRVRDHQQWNE